MRNMHEPTERGPGTKPSEETTGRHSSMVATASLVLAAASPPLLVEVYEAVPVPLVVAWSDGRLSLNAAARSLLGEAGVDDIDAHLERLDAHDDKTAIAPADFPLMRALRGESLRSVRLLVRDPAGSGGQLTLLVDAQPIVVADHPQPVGAVCVYRDVTQRALYDEMADDLLGTAAHDLRTPLTALKACVQLIQRGMTKLDAAARERTLSLLVSQVDKLSTRIDDVLDAARIRRGRVDVAPVDVDVTAELARIVAETTKLPGAPRCDADIAAGLRAHVDPARLQQAIRGLLLDAAGTSLAPGAVVKLRAIPLGEGVEIIVEPPIGQTSTRSRTARRLARTLVERLGGVAEGGVATGAIRMTLPPPSDTP